MGVLMLKVKIMHLSDLSEQIFNSWLRFASLCIVSSLGTPFYIKQLEKDRAAYETKNYDYEEYSTGIDVINSFEPHNQALEPDFNSKFMEDDIGRYKRQSFLKEDNLDSLVTQEPLLVEDPQGWGLAHVLGIASLICLVIYIIGITYKLIKMHLGTYVREEPVFLKYK